MTNPDSMDMQQKRLEADKFHKDLKKQLGQDKPETPKTPETPKQPEDQEKSFSVETGAFAIVDASVLTGIDNPLAKQAVIVPTKFGDATFTVKTEYDDTILRNLTITPKQSETEPEKIAEPGHDDHTEKGTPAEVTPPEVAKDQGVPVPTEGNAAPLSHDDTVQRSLRKHQTPRSRQHMKGSDLYRKSSPARRVLAKVKRDSRHQPKPEVEDAFQFILQNSGKQLSEDQIKSVKDPALLAEVLDLMLAMAFNNWDNVDGGTTNGDYLIEDERFSADSGMLLFNEKTLDLKFDWLYEIRQRMKNAALNVAWDLSKLVK